MSLKQFIRRVLSLTYAGKPNACCSILPDRYNVGLNALPNLKARLQELKRLEVKPGYIIRDYRCRGCGQFWRYEQEVVGHADIDERVFQLLPQAQPANRDGL
jgi:hypothetical protein